MNIIRPFYYGLKNTSILEFIAMLASIIALLLSRKENIYAYPLILINTVIFLAVSLDNELPGEVVLKFFFIAISIYGWLLWSKRDKRKHRIIRVTASAKREWINQIIFFAAFFTGVLFALNYFKNSFYLYVIPWADAFAIASSLTALWLMVRKKVESWYWWIMANLALVLLFFVKNYIVITAYHCLLLAIAIFGLSGWKKRSLRKKRVTVTSENIQPGKINY